MSGATSSPGTVPDGLPLRPGPIGRIVRLALAVVLADLVVTLIGVLADGFSGWPGGRVVELLLGISLTLWLAPTVWDVGLGRSLGAGWHAVAVAGAAMAAMGGLLAGAPATWAAYWTVAWIVVTLGWLGVSFVLAALLRTPGCEMQALRHGWNLVTGDSGGFVACPGPLQPLDEWEARTTGRAEPDIA